MLSRRQVLTSSTAAAAIALAPRITFAAAPTDARFVLVLLRGGLDGLSTAAPYADRDYRRLRGDLALGAPGTSGGGLPLDGTFALHPALEPLHQLWTSRELLLVHAIGTSDRQRSHFDGQSVLENGTEVAYATPDGWLNRTLAAIGQADRRLGLAVGPSVPVVIRGPVGVATYAPRALPELDTTFLARVRGMYQSDALLHATFEQGVQSQVMAEEVLGEDTPRGMQGPGGRRQARAGLRELFGAAGKLLAEQNGPRLAVIDTDGWDTHANQAIALTNQLGTLAGGLAELRAGLGSAWAKSVVITATEFGRTVAINGTRGTDHGTASVSLVMGGSVAGGRLVGTWPGLSDRALFEGRDLAVTTDLRSLVKGILRDHVGVREAALEDAVFPGSRAAKPLEGIVRA
jgi:uncharacterized protein (DUF1501 family)